MLSAVVWACFLTGTCTGEAGSRPTRANFPTEASNREARIHLTLSSFVGFSFADLATPLLPETAAFSMLEGGPSPTRREQGRVTRPPLCAEFARHWQISLRGEQCWARDDWAGQVPTVPRRIRIPWVSDSLLGCYEEEDGSPSPPFPPSLCPDLATIHNLHRSSSTSGSSHLRIRLHKAFRQERTECTK